MGRFSSSPLAGEHQLGGVLRQARESKGLKLAEVSRRLKLPLKYLESIEGGRWHELPEGSYARLFVRTYAQFLGVPPDELLKQFAVPARVHSTPPVPALVQRVAYGRRTLIWLGVAAVVGYLVTQAWQALESPKLIIFSPAENLSTFSPTTTVRGLTRAGTRVTVNGEVVEVSAEGQFAVEVALAPGLNTITVVADTSYAKPATQVLRVLYAPPASPSPGSKSLVP